MFLSDRDLHTALNEKRLIVEPRPTKIDPTSIDLSLDRVEEAKIWNVEKLIQHQQTTGNDNPEVRIGNYNYSKFSTEFLISPPDCSDGCTGLVQKRARQVIVKPGGFLLWQTKEEVGTPPDADLICFVEGKSTKARTGILVHLTAPTIHSTWRGKITLEIANLGSFHLVLQEGDVIAQLTVAKITSTPDKKMGATSVTYAQSGVHGQANND